MTCKTCAWLDVKPNAAGKIVVYKRDAHKCLAPIPEIVLPHSVTKGHGFRWPPSKSYVSAHDGEGCPLYKKREKK